MSTEQLETKFNDVVKNLENLWGETLNELSSLKDDQESQINTLKSEKQEIQEKYNEAQAKLDKIENQLKSTVEQLESITKTKAKGIDAMQLLDVYLVLMENVYESSAHTRLLIMLHGEKPEYTLDELTMAAGISGLQVKQAIFELRNSGLVEYDEETTVVKLKTRFME